MRGDQGGPLGPTLFFLLMAALYGPPLGTINRQPPTATNRQLPPTANRQLPPTANGDQPPTANTANRHQPPIPNHQLPPTTLNLHQPPSTASRQSPTATRQPLTHGVPVGIFGKPAYRNTSFFFSSVRTALMGMCYRRRGCTPQLDALLNAVSRGTRRVWKAVVMCATLALP